MIIEQKDPNTQQTSLAKLYVSFFEIYNEEIFDLINQNYENNNINANTNTNTNNNSNAANSFVKFQTNSGINSAMKGNINSYLNTKKKLALKEKEKCFYVEGN